MTRAGEAWPTAGMANVLSDEKKQQVVALGKLGWPLRRIEEETGGRRETASALPMRQVEAGVPVTELCRKMGVSEQFFTRGQPHHLHIPPTMGAQKCEHGRGPKSASVLANTRTMSP